MSNHTLLNLKFEDCCLTSLQQIRNIEVCEKYLAPALGIGLYTTIFFGRAGGVTSISSTGYNIYTADFESLRQVVLSTNAGVIGGYAIRKICFQEITFNHPASNTPHVRKLKLYWQLLYDAFA